MKRLIPDTIAGRTFAVLVIGLAVSHAISLALFMIDRANVADLAGAPGEGIWSIRFALSMGAMIVAVIALSAFVVYHVNAPIRLLASAAHRLGRDVYAPPVPELGPREVRQAIRAFNDMHARIRQLVDGRSQMLRAITHDLRTPITLLRLRAEFVASEAERAKILATLDDMESMIGSILAFARDDIDREEERIIDLIALIESICDDMADAGRAVGFTGSGRFPYPCRAKALKRALTNLIDNAVKYGGRADVGFRVEPSTVTIVVEDEGPGIPGPEAQKVFLPFYRIETSRSTETGGTGLGLSIARTIVQSHGGVIELNNMQGGGVRAEVRLPRTGGA